EPLQIVEFRDESGEVARAVAVRVDERAHHDLVEDGSPVPLRVEVKSWQRERRGERHPTESRRARPYNQGVPAPLPHADLLAAADVREHTVEVLGSRTRYWEYGPADAPRTIVAVHGYRGDHHGLEPVVVRLPGVRVVSPDLPGFGASTPMTGARHSVDGYGRWLRGF